MLEERAEGVEPTVEAAGAAVATVSVKLPPFWPSDPEVWFAQVEAYFTTRRITAQRTRFDHIIASLSPEVATEANQQPTPQCSNLHLFIHTHYIHVHEGRCATPC